MSYSIRRFFLFTLLAALGVGSGLARVHAAEGGARVAQNSGGGVHMQVGPNTTPEEDASADTLRVGPGNNRQRENTHNLYPNFANDVRVEVQIQPDMPFWQWGQTRPDNTRPPARSGAPERRR